VQLGLERPDHGLGQRVVVAVADGADRRRRPDLCELVGVGDRGVLTRLPVRCGRSARRGWHRGDARRPCSRRRRRQRRAWCGRAFQPTMRRENTSITNAT
jgi:hypothetical protein